MTPILKTIVYVEGLASMAGMAVAASCAAKVVYRMAIDKTSSEREQTSTA